MALNTAERVCDTVGAIARWLCLLAGVVLLVVMGFATCLDVIVRNFGLGIPGIWEAVTLAMRWMIGLALPFAFYQGSHITVELFTDALPNRLKQFVIVLSTLVTLGVVSLLAWRITLRMVDVRGYGGVTSDLGLPTYFDWVPLALGPVLSVPVLLCLFWRELFRLFDEGQNKAINGSPS
ncbi:MAG: TRAP transporter small permease [Pusillimonas sp.]|nr:TRAP transporter small permease [Pusillimonas sp.]